jgi:hypothetical protein
VLVPLLLAVEACLAVDFQIGPGNELASIVFWILVLGLGVPMFGEMLYSLGLITGSAGAVLAAMIFYIVAWGWTFFAMIWWILMLVTCDGDVNCADNIDCLGVPSGPYGGPTGRFIGIFVLLIIGFILYLMAFIICFFDMRTLKAHKVHWQRSRVLWEEKTSPIESQRLVPPESSNYAVSDEWYTPRTGDGEEPLRRNVKRR